MFILLRCYLLFCSKLFIYFGNLLLIQCYANFQHLDFFTFKLSLNQPKNVIATFYPTLVCGPTTLTVCFYVSHKHCVTVAWLDVFIIDLCFICFPHLSTQVIKTKAGSTMLCLCVSVCVFVNAVLRALSWMHSDLKLMSRFPFKAPRAHAHLSLSFHFFFFFI